MITKSTQAGGEFDSHASYWLSPSYSKGCLSCIIAEHPPVHFDNHSGFWLADLVHDGNKHFLSITLLRACRSPFASHTSNILVCEHLMGHAART